MKQYKNGDRCPCCGELIEGKADDWLELFSSTIYFMGLSEPDPVDAEAMADIDRREAEFGADGWRAFGGRDAAHNSDGQRREDGDA